MGRRRRARHTNLLTAEYLRAALAGPFSGRVFSLGVALGPSSPVDPPRPSPIHLMQVDGADFSALDRLEGFGFSDDMLITPCHASSHLDALSHVISDGRIYNGFGWQEVRSSGAARCAVGKVQWLVARAHVLDVAGSHGSDRLPDDYAIHAQELQDLCAARGVEPQPGYALLVRTGVIRERLRAPRSQCSEPGLHPDCASWIQRHDLSLVGADNAAVEVRAEGQRDMPLHRAVNTSASK